MKWLSSDFASSLHRELLSGTSPRAATCIAAAAAALCDYWIHSTVAYSIDLGVHRLATEATAIKKELRNKSSSSRQVSLQVFVAASIRLLTLYSLTSLYSLGTALRRSLSLWEEEKDKQKGPRPEERKRERESFIIKASSFCS